METLGLLDNVAYEFTVVITIIFRLSVSSDVEATSKNLKPRENSFAHAVRSTNFDPIAAWPVAIVLY